MAQGGRQKDSSAGRPGRGRPTSGGVPPQGKGPTGGGTGSGGTGSRRADRDVPPEGARRRSAGSSGRNRSDTGEKRSGGPRRGPGKGATAGERISRTEAQQTYDGPEIPAEITGRELDRSVAAQLQGLPERLALRVARHLVAAGHLVDEDPAAAYAHAKAARARASRLAVVREACGEAAYAAGEYADALTELRAARRMTGAKEYLPMIADCERALGRPERAIAMARGAEARDLPEAVAVEMTIVEAGARRDLGEIEGALRTLEAAPLHSKSRSEWSVRLRYAYADMLSTAGRSEDASEWFHRAAAIDGAGVTDAAERALELEQAIVDESSTGPVSD